MLIEVWSDGEFYGISHLGVLLCNYLVQQIHESHAIGRCELSKSLRQKYS